MTIDQAISNFLRDAQYRIGYLSWKMDELQDSGSYQYRDLYKKRLQLSVFMSILYEGNWGIITPDFNHIQYDEATGCKTTWTEEEIMREIDYLRYYTGMNEVPYVTFTGHYPLISQSSSGESGGSGSGATLPQGLYGQMLVYNLTNQLVAVDIDEYGGMLDGESINAYFSDRP
jgi:hypothetical protein